MELTASEKNCPEFVLPNLFKEISPAKFKEKESPTYSQ